MGLVATVLPSGGRAGAGAQPDAEIVSCAIHPAIGIARVGNSPDGYFLGPEIPGPYQQPPGGFKDSAGRVKRQVARFRIYGLDADGTVVRELTANDSDITWTVHLANKKAAWYNFEIPLDIPEASGQPPGGGLPAAPPIESKRRNAAVQGAARSQLSIDPGGRSINGTASNSFGGDPRFAFDSGQFLGKNVGLGELRTDDQGRLIVFGGLGDSGPGLQILSASTFANNDLWQDDTSDGPVDATVRIGGRTLQAQGAWVVVAPPNFGPGLQSVVTMYDVLFEVATKLEPDRAPQRPSFTRQIYPLLERHVQNQWVNQGMARLFGWGAASNFLDPAVLTKLGDPSSASQQARADLVRRFRNPDFQTSDQNQLPPYYGDNTNIPATTARQWMAILPIQYRWLQQWAAGDFDADWPAGGLQFPASLDDLPLSERPLALDRAALDDCLGGPFHPGCEMTWPMRIASMYESPFRLRRRSEPEPDWGSVMTSAIALSGSGPLSASSAGDITRWMAVPWQTDTASCLSAYEPQLDPYLPTFWPAHVPNDVLALAAYQTVMDPNASPSAKQAAFANRVKWLRGQPLGRGDEAVARINSFLRNWAKHGIIAQRDGPQNDPAFPSSLWVEIDRDPALDTLP
jgi:L-lysine epsilon oxidase-like protein